MKEEIQLLLEEVKKKTASIISKDMIEDFRLEYLVKKGKITNLFTKMRDVPKELKKEIGKDLNELRKFAEESILELNDKFELQEDTNPGIDLSLNGRKKRSGSSHPISITISKMIEIFTEMGFEVAEGTEIEDSYHNFDSLNFPPDHPARDMQDTFFIKDDRDLVLRTHTSPVQIRVMENSKPPIRTIMPGRVYRNEAIDSTHLAEFHQVEGLYIDKDVNLAELKATMITFAKKLYGDNLEFRFRPSFFPFTEPSAELDIRKPGSDSWMEVAGCGMVHPKVLEAGGINSEEYIGYAFGFGIERITMLKTGIDDIRLLYENDVRVIGQF
ncbi:phenylalanine--tRNA ligase subunit alpha [Candidatus Kapabacteria bacterium]|nr:phenylalanine--tRNA ligase subunit alpha [Candidatus Kapabacteria bacterium]